MLSLPDLPYCSLKKNPLAYRILVLHDFYDHSFQTIAQKSGLPRTKVSSLYHEIKARQLHCYVNHLSIFFLYSDTLFFDDLLKAAKEHFQDDRMVTAYFESLYGKILFFYREGEPGLAPRFLAEMPSLQRTWDKETLSLVIDLREKQGKSFAEIGIEMTAEPTRLEWLYDGHYFLRSFFALVRIKKETGLDLRKHYYTAGNDPKTMYTQIVEDFPWAEKFEATDEDA